MKTDNFSRDVTLFVGYHPRTSVTIFTISYSMNQKCIIRFCGICVRNLKSQPTDRESSRLILKSQRISKLQKVVCHIYIPRGSRTTPLLKTTPFMLKVALHLWDMQFCKTNKKLCKLCMSPDQVFYFCYVLSSFMIINYGILYPVS